MLVNEDADVVDALRTSLRQCESEFESHRSAARQVRDYLAGRELSSRQRADELQKRLDERECETIFAQDRFEFEMSHKSHQVSTLESQLSEVKHDLAVALAKSSQDVDNQTIDNVLQSKIHMLSALCEQQRTQLARSQAEIREWIDFAERSRKEHCRQDIEMRALSAKWETLSRQAHLARLAAQEANVLRSPRRDRSLADELAKVFASDSFGLPEVEMAEMLLRQYSRAGLFGEAVDSDSKELQAHSSSFEHSAAQGSLISTVHSRESILPTMSTLAGGDDDADSASSSSSPVHHGWRESVVQKSVQQQIAVEQARAADAIQQSHQLRLSNDELKRRVNELESDSKSELESIRRKLDGAMHQLQSARGGDTSNRDSEMAELLVYRRVAAVLEAEVASLRVESERASDARCTAEERDRSYQARFREMLLTQQQASDELHKARRDRDQMAQAVMQKERELQEQSALRETELHRRVERMLDERLQLQRSLAASEERVQTLQREMTQMQSQKGVCEGQAPELDSKALIDANIRLRSALEDSHQLAREKAAQYADQLREYQSDCSYFRQRHEEQQKVIEELRATAQAQRDLDCRPGSASVMPGSGGYLISQPTAGAAELQRRVNELSAQLEESRRDVVRLHDMLERTSAAAVDPEAAEAMERLARMELEFEDPDIPLHPQSVADNTKLIQELAEENEALRKRLKAAESATLFNQPVAATSSTGSGRLLPHVAADRAPPMAPRGIHIESGGRFQLQPTTQVAKLTAPARSVSR